MKIHILNDLKKIGTCLVLLSVLGSCTDQFSKFNTDKTQPTDEQMGGDNFKQGAFFPQMQRQVVPTQENDYQHCENMVGSAYSGYLTAINPWDGSVFANFNPKNSWIDEPFDKIFSKFYSAFNEVKKNFNGQGVNYAWARILRVAVMQRMTDMYGPIPYSKIEEAGGLNAAYDSQETVYRQMMIDLSEGIDVLSSYANRHPEDRPMADYDEVYAGDFSKWVRFGNSLKLRLAMRMANIAPQEAAAFAQEAVSHSGGLIVSNEHNAQIQCRKNPLNVMWNEYSDTRAGADLMSYLQGYADPRLPKYFQKGFFSEGGEGFYGFRTGGYIMEKDPLTGYSAPLVGPQDPLIWMTAAEVAFLRAEGALRGWESMGGTPQSFYEQGIKLSFDQWGVKGADEYLANETRKQADYTDPLWVGNASALNTITIKWQESAQFEEKLERIITQKWLAIFPLGQEAWSEYRRTGYPRLLPVRNNRSNGKVDSDKGARRLNFPPNEFLNNKVNVEAAVGMLKGPDTMGTPLWWDISQPIN